MLKILKKCLYISKEGFFDFMESQKTKNFEGFKLN